MTIKTKFKFGDSAYVVNDPDQREYIITGIICRPGSISYELSYVGDSIELYDFEISDSPDVLKRLLNDEKEEQ